MINIHKNNAYGNINNLFLNNSQRQNYVIKIFTFLFSEFSNSLKWFFPMLTKLLSLDSLSC